MKDFPALLLAVFLISGCTALDVKPDPIEYNDWPVNSQDLETLAPGRGGARPSLSATAETDPIMHSWGVRCTNFYSL